MFAGFLFLLTISAPPQILAASTVFLLPNSETKKWWVMVSFGATAAGFVLNSKRLLSTSCNKQNDAVASSIFFHGVIPDAFEVRDVMCEKLNKP